MINIFRKVVKSEDFLSMSVDDLVRLIASNDLVVFEGKVSKLKLVYRKSIYQKEISYTCNMILYYIIVAV